MIYIVKENRTYDQVLGDMKEGNGDPSLVLFGEQVTPNPHKLAREFVLLDNFYVNADVSADGHNWSTAAIAPDYVREAVAEQYAGRRKHADFVGQEPPRCRPPATCGPTPRRRASRCAIRLHGRQQAAPPTGEVQVATVRDPVLAKVTNRTYRGFDLDYPDVERAQGFSRGIGGIRKDRRRCRG